MKRLLLLPFIILFTFINAQEYWMENGSVTTCSGTFYDSGGPTGLFGNNENFVYTICPDRSTEPNNATVLTFASNLLMTSSGADYMNIYDGDDTSAPLIGTWTGGQQPGGLEGVKASDSTINPSGCLTVEFISDAVGPGPGWEATISCEVPCQVITPTVTTVPAMESDVVTILEGESVDFTGSATFSQDDSGATYTWDFGDGTTATGLNATHTYASAGTYTVTFTIVDGSGDPDCATTFTFLVSVTFDTNVPCPSVMPVDFVELSNDVIVNCNYPLGDDGKMRLRADYVEMKSTSSYVVQSIPFQPPYDVTEGAGVDITQDDVYSPWVDFPAATADTPAYKFCFFGEEQSGMHVGANGRLLFTELINDGSWGWNRDEWQYTQTLPTNTAHMMNTINGAYHDIIISTSSAPDDAQFSYGFQGTYPCRMFVVNYNKIPMFSCTSSLTTQQIVLYEASNYIDVYIHNKEECSFNSGSGLIGLQGPNQSQYAVAPGRNTSSWSAQNEAWRFIPDGPPLPVTIEWFDADGNSVGNNRNLDVYPTENTFYTVEVTYQICGGEDVVVSDRIDITFEQNPPEVEDIDVNVCDVDGSEQRVWDLTSYTNLVTDGHPDWVIEGYYTNQRAANEGVAVAHIADETAFNSGPRVVYVRVEDNSNGCAAVFNLNLGFLDDLTPENLTDTQCIAPGETEVTYNLNSFNDHYLNGEFYDIFYYENETDQQAGNDSYLTRDELLSYTISTSTTIYVRIQTEEGCFGLAELQLEVNEGPNDYVFTDPIQYCDTGTLGSEVVDLTESEEDILGGVTGITFFYYENYDDAMTNDGALAIADPTAYTLDQSTTEIYIVILDGNGCYKVITMPVQLLDGLVLTEQQISACDNDADGQEVFDLTSVHNDIIANANSFTFTHYPTEQDAIDGTNEIATPDAYTSGSATIWTVVSTTSGCQETTTIDLILNDPPTVANASLDICANPDGDYIFNLTDAEATITSGATGLTLSYFTSQTAAEDDDATGLVTDEASYTSATDAEVIYVRVVNSDECFSIAEITLNHSEQPVATAPDNIQLCDLLDDGSETVDITVNEATITGGATDVTVTYHTSLENAQNGSPSINTPTSYDLNTGTTTVYVRVENTGGCFATTQFDVIIDEGITLSPATLELCDIDSDGTENWDLSLANDDLISGTGYTFTYYPTEQDVLDGTNEITNFTSYPSGSGTVYVLVSNAQDCSSIGEITLDLKDLPSVNTNLEYEVCDPEFDGTYAFNLSDLDGLVVNSTSGVSISYHNTQAGAEDGTDEFTQADANNITTLPMEVYVRVEESQGGLSCANFTSVNLVAGVQSQINTNIDPLEACDDGFGTGTFDLTAMASVVTNENTDHWVSYHNSESDAQNDRNPIDPDNAQLAAGTVYVRVEATGKCPSITQFEVVISPKPLAEIIAPTTAFCATDSIQISANGYDPALTYEWKDRIGNLLGEGETIQLAGESGDQTISLFVTNPDTSCTADTSMEFESIEVPVVTSLNTTNNSITVSASGDGPFEYSLDGENWQQSPTFDNLAPGMYDIYIRSITAGCDGTGMSTLVLNLSNVITPNNDGLNDYFEVPFMDAFRDENGNVQKSTFSIYNRYGKQLFVDESSNEKTSFIWNGTSNGRTLPSGDYWYLLELADGRKVMGHITVKNR